MYERENCVMITKEEYAKCIALETRLEVVKEHCIKEKYYCKEEILDILGIYEDVEKGRNEIMKREEAENNA